LNFSAGFSDGFEEAGGDGGSCDDLVELWEEGLIDF